MTEAVLNVLAQSEVLADRVLLPQGLDRKLYQKVNETLEELGGKWNRKQQAHVFADDPREEIATIVQSGTLPDKNPLAFFPTPKAVIDQILGYFMVPRPPCRILEPSAGLGAIAEALWEEFTHWPEAEKAQVRIDLVEWDKKRAAKLAEQWEHVYCQDFLTFIPEARYDAVFMNPPFSVEGNKTVWIDHVQHAFDLLLPGGQLVAVVPNSAQFRIDKKHQGLRDWLHPMGGFLDLPEGCFKESGTGVSVLLLHLLKPDDYEDSPLEAPEQATPMAEVENRGSQVEGIEYTEEEIVPIPAICPRCKREFVGVAAIRAPSLDNCACFYCGPNRASMLKPHPDYPDFVDAKTRRENVENHGSQTRPETAHLLRKVEEPLPAGYYKTVTGEIRALPTTETKQYGGKREKVVSKHTKSFTFPNGDTVEASYVRFDPRTAQLTYTVGRDRVARFHERTQQRVEEIERLLQTRLSDAFTQAVLWEQKGKLKRATPPNHQPPDKSLYTMSAEAAKFYAGQYAFCIEVKGKWLPIDGRAIKDTGIARYLWEKFPDSRVRLCGCCRYERRWVRLQFDPLAGIAGYGEEASCPTSLTGDSDNVEAVSTGEPLSTPIEARPSSSPPSNATTSRPTTSGSRRLKRKLVQV